MCPGRGSYNRDELGYLARHHSNKAEFIAALDAHRRHCGQIPVMDLDRREKFSSPLHSTGDNASALIYACALADFLSIDRDKFDIVAVTGNSMGWYLALAAGGATSLDNGMHIVNTMGTLMHREASGGQIIYPLCDEQWRWDADISQAYAATLATLAQDENNKIYHSIDLGSMSVLAANTAGHKRLLAQLAGRHDRYPMSLPFHGAFHSPLMRTISATAFATLPQKLFGKPNIPLIDGRGHIWQPHASNVAALYHYTFGHQVCDTYNFSAAIEVACKEFAPDCLILLGPGSSLGPPTAQQLIKMRWRTIDSKGAFKAQQEHDPFIFSMGIEAQRRRVALNDSHTEVAL